MGFIWIEHDTKFFLCVICESQIICLKTGQEIMCANMATISMKQDSDKKKRGIWDPSPPLMRPQ